MGVMQQNRRNSTLLGADNNALMWLIAINAVVFVLVYFIKIIYLLSNDPNAVQHFNGQVLQWVTLPANANKLLSRPWTMITYMFTHDNVWGLISTLLWLWGFGYILQDLTGNKKLIPIYLYGGFFGAIFFLLTINTIPALRAAADITPPMVGAGSAIMAIAIATTTFAPKYRLLPMLNGGIPLWILTLVFVAFDYATVASNPGTAVAHLAGAGVGYLYVKQLQHGNDMGAWMLSLGNWVINLCNPDKQYTSASIKQQIFYKASKKPYEKISRFSQQRLDEILDKINEDGYSSLSNDEKEFLKKASKEDL